MPLLQLANSTNALLCGGRTHDDVNGPAGCLWPRWPVSQLLDAFEQLQHQHQAQPQQGLEVIRSSPLKLTSEPQSLSSNRRDSLQLRASNWGSLKVSRRKCSFKDQRKTTQSRLDSIYQLLGHSADATPSLTASPYPSLSYHTSKVFSTGSFNCQTPTTFLPSPTSQTFSLKQKLHRKNQPDCWCHDSLELLQQDPQRPFVFQFLRQSPRFRFGLQLPTHYSASPQRAWGWVKSTAVSCSVFVTPPTSKVPANTNSLWSPCDYLTLITGWSQLGRTQLLREYKPHSPELPCSLLRLDSPLRNTLPQLGCDHT